MPIPGVPSWIGDLSHLNALAQAAFAANHDGQIIFANTTARQRYRFLGDDLSRVTLSEGLLPEGEHPVFVEIERQALSGTQWTGRLQVRRVDGTVRAADVSCSPLLNQGVIEGIICVVDDAVGERGQAGETRRLEDRLTRLARVVTDLGSADDVEAVTKIVISEAADAVGATVASLSRLVDSETLELVGLRGGLEGASQRWATFSVHDHTPVGDALRAERPLVLIGSEIRDRYPDMESAADGPRSMVILPMKVLGKMIGAITLSFPGRRQLDNAELEFFGILADSCAQAFERIHAHDEAVRQTSRLQFLAEATAELSRSLDYQQTLIQVARLAVPTFADWSAIDLVEDDRLHRLAVEHVDPAKVRFAVEIEQRYPSERNTPGGVWDVIRTARSSLIRDVTDEMLVAAAKDEEHLRLARELQLRSALLVPLIARGRVLGVITWVAAESGRRYTEADVTFAEDLAKRCAVAIDNSQLYSETMEAAVRLQEAVLPNLSAGVEGWDLAEFYSPSGRTEVGGDFFDAVVLPDGRLAMFVGDVMGRGVAAAAAMAQIRASVRAYTAIDPAPDSVLRKLDQLFDAFGLAQLVTLVYVVLDPGKGELTIVNAGHPPPVILRADGEVEQLPFATGAPLGVAAVDREVQTLPFAPGDTVMAFTDGLIERRDEDIDEGQRRLLETVPLLGQLPLPEALSQIVATVRDHTREDDVAVLAVRSA